MSCANPIDAAVLADYWLAATEQSEEKRIEEHLFGCEECGTRLDVVIALADEVRKLACEGSLTMIVTDAFVEHAAAHGSTVREYTPPRNGSVECTVTPEDDFLIGHLAANLIGTSRVDLSFCDARGVEQMRSSDIPFRPGADGVTFQQSITYAKASPSQTMIARLVGYDETGAERLLGEYTFHHTRTLPGPGAW